MLLLIIVLALVAGFFQSALELEKKKSRLLEAKLSTLETGNTIETKKEEMEF